LSREVLHDRWVLAVAGTHGKTSTSSLLTWILEYAGLSPGFLIGGIPGNFNISARLGMAPFFVIESDEYDTAFFDKRAKFVHYRPRTVILNNLEFDHADIYADLAAIQRQFHHLVRIVPGTGLIVHNGADPALAATLAMGCWTRRESFARLRSDVRWAARLGQGGDHTHFEVLLDAAVAGQVSWSQTGGHSVDNALAAIAAARHAGVPVAVSCAALGEFKGVKRRMELRGEAGGVKVYDDFAHHPTAIATTIDGLRRRVGAARILAVLEPRSNTMKMGIHRDTLGPSLAGADEAWVYAPPDLGWDAASAVTALGAHGHVARDIESLVTALAASAHAGDHLLIMSNGGFDGLHEKLLAKLAQNTNTRGTGP
jgi:UDP-N-acetylmuramate: L-alanyl-gamma-D-glutamyl-meso-diaminopimelate ligase